ncbi:hypothetical protein JHL18_19335 [Clostridium sp. YIM B02505]|uniref:Permuted papain-like amidase enzyme, YaeF/YiiX, C92 family n=1 Tax=Clostridium yunnanense TaxID=2800325 RepID=A0ABS1ETS5_9CLOT|nr:hypothetical protein [Clostridium yunnanense]MBK1812779.1 hypothetical protein [Clostridium yunnanense]
MKTIAFSELKDDLKTGDLILFSGKYSISKLVEKLEHSMWSHAAMVVRIPNIEYPLLWESSALTNLSDELYKDNKTGPKIVNLEERLKTYGSDLKPYTPPIYAVRRLEVERTDEMINSLNALFTSLHGLPNPDEWKMILEVVEGKLLNIPSKLDNYTCSELVAESLIKMGLLENKRVINSYMPKDFSSDGSLKLLKGTLLEEIAIDINK